MSLHSVDDRLTALNLALPTDVTAAASYKPGVRTANSLVLSGQLPRVGLTVQVTGKLGIEVTLEEGRRGAEICVLRLLSVARDMLGSLDQIAQIVELRVFVNSDESFIEHSAVADAASELLVRVFGKTRGAHARTAVGVAQLPKNAAVEIAAVFALAV